MNTECKGENVSGQGDQASGHRHVGAELVWACGVMDTGDRQLGKLPIGKTQLMRRGKTAQAEVGTCSTLFTLPSPRKYTYYRDIFYNTFSKSQTFSLIKEFLVPSGLVRWHP